jgi:hypothetical protein
MFFTLHPSIEIPKPGLMAYVQRFTSIPKAPSRVSGLYVVAKLLRRNSPCYEIIAASQIARPCPLSPYIVGAATPQVGGSDAFLCYDKFYINKYRTPRDFTFIHSV